MTWPMKDVILKVMSRRRGVEDATAARKEPAVKTNRRRGTGDCVATERGHGARAAETSGRFSAGMQTHSPTLFSAVYHAQWASLAHIFTPSSSISIPLSSPCFRLGQPSRIPESSTW